MKNSYINKMGQVIQPKDLEKTADEINALKKVVANPTLAGTEAELNPADTIVSAEVYELEV